MRQLIIIALLVTSYAKAQTIKVSLDSIKTECVSDEATQLCEALNITSYNEVNVKLLTFILDWRGTPYSYGGNDKTGVDCSAFSQHLYESVFGMSIPRVSNDIYMKSMPIKRMNLYQGDMVFFVTSSSDRITHMGVYLWDGYFAHASSSKGVMISNLSQGYYQRTFVSGGAWLD